MPLLNDNEVNFLDVTKDSIQKYVESDFISDWLIRCTNNRINQRNYDSNFEEFIPCLQTKMLRLSTTSQTNFDLTRSRFRQNTASIEIPPFIRTVDIAAAIFDGYNELEPFVRRLAAEENIDLSRFENYQNTAIVAVLIIIARANLERRFSE